VHTHETAKPIVYIAFLRTKLDLSVWDFSLNIGGHSIYIGTKKDERETVGINKMSLYVIHSESGPLLPHCFHHLQPEENDSI